MPIRTRRWNDAAEPGDGARILVCRWRPRALKKSAETWQEWRRELAPSVELHAAIYGKRGAPIGWPAFRGAYLREMRGQRDAIGALARRVAAGETLTLLCASSCADPSRCHRSLLQELIERDVARRSPPGRARKREA